MSVICKPNTTLGIWSVRLIGASILFFVLFSVIVASGQRGGETFFSNLALTIPMLIAFILAVCAFFTGALSIIRNREQAVFVFLSTAMGFLVLLFGLIVIIFPY